jgi:uncharacterized protein
MPSLSDKLKSLGVKTGASHLAPPPPRRPNVEQVLGGRLHPTSGGGAYVVEEFYPLDYAYGRSALRLDTRLNAIARWAGGGNPAVADLLAACSESQFAYLDIETTGLMGGTGTYPFLVGMGRMEAEGFHLVQFFMRDPGEEPAHLLAIEEFLAPCQALVTYNGKSFDVPVLNARFTTHRWKTPFASPAHLDLLPLARRLWREHLSSRTLGNVETLILGAHRSEEDVPGWMIPQLYFEYLQTGDARPLKSVFYHNAMDVLAMAALLNHLSALLEGPGLSHEASGGELAGLARFYEDMGQIDEACRLYHACLDSDLTLQLRWDTTKRLALIYKRRRDFQSALPLWEQAASLNQLEAFEELAKYYEHQAGEFSEALRWTEIGINAIRKTGLPGYARKEWQQSLEHRRARLLRKLDQGERP